MQIYAHQLSSQIIFAHMNHKPLQLSKLAENKHYRIAFYDQNGSCLAGQCFASVNLGENFREKAGHVRIVDRSTFGHKGVDAIVLEDDTFGDLIAQKRLEIIVFWLSALVAVSILGYILARLFMEPVRSRREKLDQFIKESTHELNTPISALLMSVDAKGSDANQHDERIKISARRLSEIYADLTYLFLRSHEEHPVVIELGGFIKRQIESLVPLAERKKVTFTLEVRNRLSVLMDKESLTRLVSNLLNNAIKYNKIGGKIIVRIEGDRLSVEDTGIGIASEKLGEIYKRFYRATEESGGFGLGLHIVHKICRRYGIDLDVVSKEGEGTKFTLRFPHEVCQETI